MARPPQRRPPQGGGTPGPAGHKFILFDDLPKMNTKPMRQNLTEQEAAWMENLQPVAGNDLVVVPAPLFALTNVVGKTVSRMFPAAIRTTVADPTAPTDDLIIFFATDGSATAINAADGYQVEFAPPGTFVTPSDMTTYNGERILIADPGVTNPSAPGGFTGAGYSTWDGATFVSAGGVSPNFNISNVGTGYTSQPAVTISGGSGSGATAYAVVSGGQVVQIVLTNPGTGYLPTDQLTVSISGGGGSGATATVVPWPRIQATSVAVFQGRVWTSFRRTINYTGTAGFDDTDPANAAGFFEITDADLVHEIVGLRALNNYLTIFGDQSVKQIGGIAVQPAPTNSAGQPVGSPTTNFQVLTLASDIGCPFIMSVLSYNRLTVFANKQGVYAIYGATVMKESDELDGIFRRVDWTQEPTAALFDLNNIHCYSLMVRYQDPDNIPVFGVAAQGGIHERSLILVQQTGRQSKAWWCMNQGMDLAAIMSLPMLATDEVEMFGTSGNDITWLVADPSTAVTWILKTPLSAHGNLIKAKTGIKAGIALSASEPVHLSMSVDTENKSNVYELHASRPIRWRNKDDQFINFAVNTANPTVMPAAEDQPGVIRLDTRAAPGELRFMIGPGFQLPYASVDAYGRVIGITAYATNTNLALNALMIEYSEADDWGIPP